MLTLKEIRYRGSLRPILPLIEKYVDRDWDAKDVAVAIFDEALTVDIPIWEHVHGNEVYVRAIKLIRLVTALEVLLAAWDRQNKAWGNYLTSLGNAAVPNELREAMLKVAGDGGTPDSVRLHAALRAIALT